MKNTSGLILQTATPFCVVRYPYDIEPEDGGCIMGFSFHTGDLWCEIPGQDNHGKRPKEIHIGPLVKIHNQFPAALLERGFGPDTHYLLGRKHGGFPLRVGSRPAVEALLDELKAQWQEYRRASDPEYRLAGLRAIRRARAVQNSAKLKLRCRSAFPTRPLSIGGNA